MTKYLQYIPKTLQEDFINNSVIPLVGAGFSKNAQMPTDVTMPDWDKLGRNIATYIMDYDFTNALDALSIFESEYSRVKLIELLSKELHIHEIKPSRTYIAFCDVFYDTICTTNFDFLLDETLQLSNRPVSVIVSEDKLSINMNNATKLIKLHGDFNHPNNMVVTEKDYDLFLEKNKLLATYISNLFITKTLFLVGYSFDDIDTRNIWQIINSRLGDLKKLAYCVMVDASRTEIARFERRNIKVINIPGKKENCSKILEEFFNELKVLISNKSSNLLQATDNKIKEELILPNEINRLCYIAAPHQFLSQIKETVSPILAEYSITPMTLDEVLLPSDNWLAKSELLIKKSNIAIVDITMTNDNVNWELTTLTKNNKFVILIAKKDTLFRIMYVDHPVITYNSLYDDEFISQLQHEISLFNEKLSSDGLEEVNRLFNKNEFNASAIAAFRLLEDTIRKSNINFESNMSKFTLSSMLIELNRQKIINTPISDIKKYISIRNELVHSNINISKSKATLIIKFAESTIKSIQRYKD